MQGVEIGQCCGTNTIRKRLVGCPWRCFLDEPKPMRTLARCSYLPEGPILSTAFPAGQQSDGVTLRIGIDQLRADLAKPDPVIGMCTLVLGQIGVIPRPADGGGGYVCGHPKVQLSVARGVRPERQPVTVRVRAIMRDRSRNPVLRGLVEIVSHGSTGNRGSRTPKAMPYNYWGIRQPRPSMSCCRRTRL